MASAQATDTLWLMSNELPRRVEKPWGYEIWWAHTDEYAGKILHVNAGHRLSLQYHVQKDESCYLLAGKLLLVQGDSAEDLTETVISDRGSAARRPFRGSRMTSFLVNTLRAAGNSEMCRHTNS
jgi:uncharacterized protein YndB with AHSA1/START domain